jgi:hypothetical protein
MSEFTFKEFANKVSDGVHKLVETDFETYLEFVNDGVRVSLEEYYGDDELNVIWRCRFINSELTLSDSSIVSRDNLNEFILFLNELIDARFYINQHLKKIEELKL